MKIVVLHISLVFILTACASSTPQTPSQTPQVPSQTPIAATPKPFPTPLPEIWIGDGGLISGNPCLAPCFNGVRIGETMIDQVIPILDDNRIYPCIQDTSTSVFCSNKILVEVNSSSYLVVAIGYYPNVKISIGEIILKYGEPNIIHVVPTGIPEGPTTVILLLFDELGMRIRLPTIDGREYKLSASSKVELVNYFDEVLYQEMRQNLFSQPWNGYGAYYPKE